MWPFDKEKVINGNSWDGAVIEVSKKGFKVTLLTILKDIKEYVFRVNEQIRYFSAEKETIKTKWFS